VSDFSIRIRGLGKRFTIGAREQTHETLRDKLAAATMRPFRRLQTSGFASVKEIWALRDISHDIRRGEVVGVIGGNGAGKSTLLKILSRITEPTAGEAEIHGRVGSLLEVGTGFHPDLTGRENIFLNGAILGMKQADIARKFDEIVAFAEIDQFIDTPVRHYSSGMFIRLGFAVAAQMDPEILIVDEVLAVGDIHFQRKCLGTLDDVARGGRTVLFVSHNMAAIQRLCTSAIVLQRGRLVHAGDVRSTVGAYLSGDARGGFLATGRTGRPQIIAADLEDTSGQPLTNPVCTEPIVCCIRFALPQPAPDTRVGIKVLSSDGAPIFTTDNEDAGVVVPTGPGDYSARVTIPANVLLAGEFHITLLLSNRGGVLDQQEPGLTLSLETGPSPLYRGYHGRAGYVHVTCGWQVQPELVDALAVSGTP
jgi:lipopolysaccharide transport system ATP-binding protein